VENVIISGSRCRGIEKNGSDLDVVVDYKGTIREDDFFNILHEDGFTIAGIAIDINPITEDKTGLLAEYLESVEQYLKEKAQERKLKKPSVREKIKQAKQITQEKKKVNIEKLKNAER
jgi:predicted nucleotidyltransferase